MNKVDYDKILRESVSAGDKLVLHCCCAPCACYPVEMLSELGAKLTLLYYNPNITDSDEYRLRLQELRRLGDDKGLEVIDGGERGKDFLKRARGLENEPEGGARCAMCIDDRLHFTAVTAAERGADGFLSTLTVSPLKNAEMINALGLRYPEYIPSDFKKRDGYKRGIAISNSYGFYRQNFCGCEFSRRNTVNEGK